MALRVDPASRLGGLLIRLAAGLVRLLVGVVGWTCRFEVVAGEAHLERLLEPTGEDEPLAPAVICFWHQRAILAAPLFKRWVRGGLDVSVMISQSRDGEMVSQLARWWGFDHVRGSATRGGSAGLRRIYRALRAGSSPILLPDGPQGPVHRVKAGVVVLAQLADRPVLPLAFACDRAWRIRSWDRLFVPKPWSTIRVAAGEPLRIDRDPSADTLERERQRLEAALTSLTDDADRAAYAGNRRGKSAASAR